jgi:GNAT superfamily N-acetyltransferase
MPDLRAATLADVDAIAAVLAASFQDDPGTAVFEPDRGRRAGILPPFFRTWVAAALADGGDLVVPEGQEVLGVASWFGPERHGPGIAAMEAAGLAATVEAFGPDATGRLLAMTGELERQHDLLAPWPHLRLDFFGVHPAAQGTGVGTRLIEHGHRRADALGLPCYLETFTRTNVGYYERRGWRVIATYEVADGVPVHAMMRPGGASP